MRRESAMTTIICCALAGSGGATVEVEVLPGSGYLGRCLRIKLRSARLELESIELYVGDANRSILADGLRHAADELERVAREKVA